MTSSNYIPFLKILKILDFIAKTRHFSQKSFLFLEVKNSKFQKSETITS